MSGADLLPELRSARDLIRWGASEFVRNDLYFGHGTDNALDEAYALVCWVLKLGYELPAEYLGAAVTAAERAEIVDLIQQRISSRKPAAYLTGEAWFCGLSFVVDERVLVPRSPLAELIQQEFSPWLTTPPGQVLDLCCGSGCIGIAAAHVLPDAEVDLLDIDEGALELASQNVARHGLQAQVSVRQSDLFAAVPGKRYDLILSNPPYVPSEDYAALAPEFMHEPRLGLEAGADGMDLVARILAEAPDHLSEAGTLICEVGAAMDHFLDRFATLEVIWPDFEHGGEGIFIVGRDALLAWQQQQES